MLGKKHADITIFMTTVFALKIAAQSAEVHPHLERVFSYIAL